MPTLKVMSARAVQAAVRAIAAQFIKTSGGEVDCEFAPVGALEKKLAAGAYADVLILSAAAMDAAEKTLVPASRRVLGRTSIGVAVRAGAPLPDIGTPQALRKTLLAARCVAVSDVAVGGTAGKYLAQLFARMGIAEEIRLLRRSGGGDVARCVADGVAEIGMTFISEILPIPGTQVVGALPAPLTCDTTYAAAIAEMSGERARAAAFIESLVRPETRDIWQRAGFC